MYPTSPPQAPDIRIAIKESIRAFEEGAADLNVDIRFWFETLTIHETIATCRYEGGRIEK